MEFVNDLKTYWLRKISNMPYVMWPLKLIKVNETNIMIAAKGKVVPGA
jgi:hypothetical protein